MFGTRFADKLKNARMDAGLTQEELALQLGVTCRTQQNYESGSVYPKKREIYSVLAEIFHTDVNYWLAEGLESEVVPDDEFSVQDVALLADKVSSFFIEGDLDDAAVDQAMRKIQSAYCIFKDRSKDAQV